MNLQSEQEFKDIEKIFYKLSWKHSRVFDDWINIVLATVMRNEEDYQKAIKGFEKEELTQLGVAMFHLMGLMKKTNLDVLGHIYETIARSGKGKNYLGQFFTPYNICEMMAEMTAEDSEEPQKILDPCCGSGRLLVHMAKKVPSESTFVGQDLDYICFKMTALNMCFFNMNGYALCGDSLRMETRAGIVTKRSYLGGSMRWMAEEEYNNVLHSVEEAKPDFRDNGKGQLVMF